MPLADDVDLDSIARGTVGMTGADLRNLVNEAALLATREDKDKVDMRDFDAARDKVLMGAKREEVLTDEGQAADRLPRGGPRPGRLADPEGRPRPQGDDHPPRPGPGRHPVPARGGPRRASTRARSCADLTMALGGRAAERLVFDDPTAGAADDLKQATRLARLMVTQWGMSERLGPVFFRASEEHPFLGREMSETRDYSEHTAQIIDEEVGRILREADDRAFHLLEEHRDDLERLTEALIEREVLTVKEIEELIGKRAGAPADVSGDEVAASIDNPVA